ncbi:MAG: 1-acyl-sn-glycerol-3-phosphate acyltransferase [Myxococcales bacterium]|nr:1-acyl-sn-glycerol-3-phosphate acyltransferase [Myxococcales bacterium]
MSTPGELGMYDPAFVAEHAPWLRRGLFRYFRADVSGLEHLPEGPFVAVGNHSGATLIPDTLVWLAEYHTAGRSTPLLTLAHDQLFTAYPAPLSRALARLGAVRACPSLARRALDAGYAVQLYPGGDYDACRSYARRDEIVFAGRRGYVDLAREAGVPLVPVVSHGAHAALFVLWDGAALAEALDLPRRLRLATFPLSLSLPWGLWLGPLPGYWPLPTRITVRALPPVSPEGPPDEVDARVRDAMQAELTRLALRARRERRGRPESAP